MTSEDLIQLAILGLMIGGMLVGYGAFRQQVTGLRDQVQTLREDKADKALTDNEIAQLREQVGEAKAVAKAAIEAAGRVQGLSSAVEHLTTNFGEKISHLTEVFTLQTKALGDRVESFAHEQKNMRVAIDQVGRRVNSARRAQS
jgi:predicted  nucleic acid-binding Zn-ribbon protein